MNFVFLMDPLPAIKIKKDTTFILMLEAYRRKHDIYHLAEGSMTLENGRGIFKVTKIIPQKNEKKPFIIKKEALLTEKEIDILFIRTNPPFPYEYLIQTWLLERFRNQIPMVNDPAGIRTVNEKIWVSQFTSVIPKTLISRQKERILRFIQQEKDVILKPTGQFGGCSIFHVRQGHENTKVAVETLSRNYTQDIVVQKYIPEAKKGDKRILLLNGEPLGAVLRVHPPDDHRNNFFAGGHPAKTVINKNDYRIIELLRPHLRRLGLCFTGIDIIGEHLIEVNVTSPTCLQEMNKLYHLRLEKKVIDFAENLAVNFTRKK